MKFYLDAELQWCSKNVENLTKMCVVGEKRVVETKSGS